MAARDARARLEHLLESIEAIERYTRGKEFGDYCAQSILRDAVERNIERISEASRHIPEELKTTEPTIAWRKIAGIGNILRHGYEGIDDRIIWNTVRLELPPLKAAVEAMLHRLQPIERS